LLFKPARALGRPDDEHLGPVLLTQAISEGVGDPSGGKILVFNVDMALRSSDCVDVQGLDLPHLWTARIGRLSASNNHIDVRDVGRHLTRPGVGVDWRGRDALPGPAEPALSDEFCERLCCWTVYQELDIMEGWIGHATMIDAPWMLGQMLGRIPASDGEIQATGEGNGVVHDDDLLVQGRTDRVIAVEAELEPSMGLPAQLDDR